jgi:exosortase/archaeosortase family protein
MKKYLSLFPLAAVGLYLVNILRVYLLVLIGATISPKLAIQLFHTYAGMLLFIAYFFLFWTVFYRKISKK